MSQPQIKVVPFEKPNVQAEEHAYDPGESSDTPQEKPIGQMYAQEFTELMVKAIIQANRVQNALDEPHTQEEINHGPVSKVLGTVADVCHGVVDIAEGVLRGAIDVTTFNKGKRN